MTRETRLDLRQTSFLTNYRKGPPYQGGEGWWTTLPLKRVVDLAKEGGDRCLNLGVLVFEKKIDLSQSRPGQEAFS